MYIDAPKPGQTPDGAEEWQAPTQVRPASRILSEMVVTAASQGEAVNSADVTRMADAFTEDLVSLIARSFSFRAVQIRELTGYGDLSARDSLLAEADVLDEASRALEVLLPREKREDRRRE